jgi:D-alanyl-lipoteichoic acid acyltransferase DltB (MBOAT superfamily)
MAFNSILYLQFLSLVVLVHHLLPQRFKLFGLLTASWFFYAQWNWSYLGLIIASTVLDHQCARGMFRFSRYKKWFLLASCCGNGALLFSFKYLGFFQDIAIQLCELMGRPIYLEPLELILPVGISFYTLQTLSYTIDVYRGNIPHEPSILRFGCYVAFFPQLVAGPIERASHLLPQFKNLPAFNWISLSDGARRVLWGLFKKVVIADRIAPHIQWVLLEHSSPNPAAVFWAGILGNVFI